MFKVGDIVVAKNLIDLRGELRLKKGVIMEIADREYSMHRYCWVKMLEGIEIGKVLLFNFSELKYEEWSVS